MKIDLSGRVVLVTGASRGIGEAIALSLGSSGATVAAHANSNPDSANNLINKIGNNSRSFQADLSDASECLQLVRDVLNHFGRLDVIINNAGIALNTPPEGDFNRWFENWNKTMAVNLNATAILCREAVDHFLKNSIEGIIINVSSRAAFRGDTKEYLAYAASKGGVEALTKSIARAYGKQNITCFGIAPGFTKTAMAQEFIDEYGEDYALHDIALSRLTEPGDIAPLITFLASGLASHATGATFHINAGSYMH